MKKLLLLSWVVLVAACSQTKKEPSESELEKDSTSHVSLEKLWASDTILTTPESVYYDRKNDVLYVSCIGAVPPTAKDGDGFIAKVSPKDGSIMNLKWITGLDAPKGMGLVGSTLYVTDIDQLVAINIATGEVSERYPIEGANFLNDVETDGDGNVYFSDSGTNKIHLLSKTGELSIWVEEQGLGGPNGLLLNDDLMMVGGYGVGNFNTVDLSTLEVKTVVDTLPGADGVEKVGKDFLVSNWNGEVYYITSDWGKEKILDTKTIANAADIEFISESMTVLVPTFFGNQVVAYKLSK